MIGSNLHTENLASVTSVPSYSKCPIGRLRSAEVMSELFLSRYESNETGPDRSESNEFLSLLPSCLSFCRWV
jgi:hypothetical protein